MTEAELKKVYQMRDRVARAITTDGKFRAAAITNTNAAKEAQRRHQLDPVASLLMARGLAAASLLSSFLKGEERIVVEAMGNGVIKKVFAEALQVGEVRGYVESNSKPDMPNEALGIGLFRVTKILYGKFEPVQGMVDLQRGNITTDLAYYLTQSEQIPSAVRLDVDVSDDNVIHASAGLIVQALPGATEAEIMHVQNSIIELGPISELARSGYKADDILRQAIPSEIEVLNNTPVDYFCRCSMDKFKSILATLGINEIQSMKDSDQNELVCQYCNNHYYLTEEDFTSIITQLKAQQN
ncbi:MAG: Hsp33 family molecular chaperone HslO [Candidatus Kapaibacterium sp.]|nr:Hsp33 family molecular chaperone HslO [Bacteroidota bacterium]